jgi:drug/metabolite transporter (DMT)-like permease
MAWLMALCFLAATAVLLLLEFNVTASEPASPPGNDLVSETVAFFKDQQARWPQELAVTLLFALGFFLLIGLAVILRRLFGKDDVRSSMAAASLGIGAGIAAASQLAFIGAKRIAIDPNFCQCEYAPEQIISQSRALDMAESAQAWLVVGFLVLGAAGLFLFAGANRDRRLFPPSWSYVSQALAALLVVALVGIVFDIQAVNDLSLAIISGVLVPIWAILLARRLRSRVTV